MSAFVRLLPAFLLASCARPTPSLPSEKTTELDPRPSYPRTLAMPDGCEWPLELEQIVCALDSAITQPALDPARRGCAERHMGPIRREIASYASSFNRLEVIRAQRSRPLAKGPTPPGVGPDPTRNPEEPLGSRDRNGRAAERDQRAEMARQEEELALRKSIERSQQKLSEVFRYVEPCLDMRIPFEAAPPPPPPAASGAAEL